MRVICPTCNTGYRIPTERIPPGRKAAATCKKCGGRISIEHRITSSPPTRTHSTERHGPSSGGPPSTPKGAESGEFAFSTEDDVFRGYAGFWKRLAAAVIDQISLVAGGFIFGGLAGFVYGLCAGTAEGTEALGRIIGITIGWLYFAFLESSARQATLGKMALGIQVTDLSGDGISFGRATGRHFGKIISAFTLLVGYFMAGFTRKKQGLHDIMAGCLVVNARA
jgi:predicted Zn finger-like uncharacterized protein